MRNCLASKASDIGMVHFSIEPNVKVPAPSVSLVQLLKNWIADARLNMMLHPSTWCLMPV